MNTENEHDYFRCLVDTTTERAVKVQLVHNHQTYWVPKSVCELKEADNGGHIMEVEAWYAKKEGMHD